GSARASRRCSTAGSDRRSWPPQEQIETGRVAGRAPVGAVERPEERVSAQKHAARLDEIARRHRIAALPGVACLDGSAQINVASDQRNPRDAAVLNYAREPEAAAAA